MVGMHTTAAAAYLQFWRFTFVVVQCDAASFAEGGAGDLVVVPSSAHLLAEAMQYTRLTVYRCGFAM